MENHLPFHSGPVDVLRYGFQSLEYEAASTDPVMNLVNNVGHSSLFFSLLDSFRREKARNGMIN
jgi:hypothetical protein